MWNKIAQNFEHFSHEIAYLKILTSLAIIIAAMVLAKIAAVMLERVQNKVISRLRKAGIERASNIETRVTIIRRVCETGIYLLAVIMLLWQFEPVRHLGAAFLASAGVAGIVIGLAAQSTLSNVIGGIFISFSQPVRLGDAVIFRNEFGWIEEIAIMHTIIRTWDNRRIMVPNSILFNEVIENWTITDKSLVGSVTLYVDYLCDVEKVRAWAKEIVDVCPYATAQKMCVVDVIDFTERSMVLRVLSSGADAEATWNLRCFIRERLIKKFKEENLPLPQIRCSLPNSKIPSKDTT